MDYFSRVVAAVNATDADIVCFTGDLVEDVIHEEEALRILSTIRMPIYAVPGNHDEWALRSFDRMRETIDRTGGKWVEGEVALCHSNRVAVLSSARRQSPTPPGYKRILLEHYPAVAASFGDARFDLVLAGHSHGGQVRIPLLGAFILPYDVGPHDQGLFEIASGRLHVSPGLGTYLLNVRFLCRPEITVLCL